jgi:hypothetical protein
MIRTIPFRAPVSPSRWKNSTNVGPYGSLGLSAIKMSPP